MASNDCPAMGQRKGAWSQEEDVLLRTCIENYGEGKWHLVPARAGLRRCRKSCRLRWLNYLKPDIKRGEFEEDEVDLIFRMHRLLGNRWALIAGRIPGRTANDIKNYWNSHLSKKLGSKVLVASHDCSHKDGDNPGAIKQTIGRRMIAKNEKKKDKHDREKTNASTNVNGVNIVAIKPRPLNLSPNYSYSKDPSVLPCNVGVKRPRPSGIGGGLAHPSPSNEETWWRSLLSEGDEGRDIEGGEIGGGAAMECGDWSLDIDHLWKFISS